MNKQDLNLLDIDVLISATEVIEPHYWNKHKLAVVRDGYWSDDNATRIHVVKEQLQEVPVLIDNAIIVSEVF